MCRNLNYPPYRNNIRIRLPRWLREESPDDSVPSLLTSRPDRPLRVEPAIGKMEMPHKTEMYADGKLSMTSVIRSGMSTTSSCGPSRT